MKKILFTILILVMTACASTETQTLNTTLEITSPAFTNGGSIPVDYSCDGGNINPALSWAEPPAGTKSFALIMDDPDASSTPWVHWVIFNIPASARGLDKGLPTDGALSDGSVQGRSSAYSTGYHGPCPPSGAHHYVFKLYALDTMLSLDETSNKTALLEAMEGHTLANGELIGTFGR
jgi:Raf kinase inhibitor-like YbhB/YbcL family protein